MVLGSGFSKSDVHSGKELLEALLSRTDWNYHYPGCMNLENGSLG